VTVPPYAPSKSLSLDRVKPRSELRIDSGVSSAMIPVARPTFAHRPVPVDGARVSRGRQLVRDDALQSRRELAEGCRGAKPRATQDVAAAKSLSQEERHAWNLRHLGAVGSLSPREYVTTLGIVRRTAIRDLRALQERGLIEAHGTTTDRRYTLRREGD
jgi:hypothetical protein